MTHSARFSTLLSFAALVVLAWSLAPRAGAEDETKGREEQAVRTQQPADVTEAFWDAYRAEQWEEAIACGLKMEAAHPGGSLIAYNLACVYSRAGDAENALKWLGAAAERGFSSTDLVREDADLATIRPLDEFGEIVQRIDQNEKMEREAVRQLFIEHPPKILLPREYDPKRPMGVLISLHGYGGRATGYPLRWRRTAAEFGLILVAPQAVHRVEGTVGYAWGGMEETEFLMDITLEALREQFTIDEDRIIISGFSQGGFLAAALAARNPERYFGSIPMAGPHYAKVEFPKKPALSDTPRFYFMVGEHDRLRPDTEQASKYFERLGYDVKFRVYEAPGHTYPDRTHYELSEALKFILEAAVAEPARPVDAAEKDEV